MTFVNAAVAVAIVTVLSLYAPDAAGHVAPSVDDNNRYLKVTPLADGIRVAYTVFFGEIPGASERKLIDANHDGTVDDAEGKRYGDKLAAQVAGAIDIEVDGKPQKLVWQIVDVGMGSQATAAGSFSVDLVTYLCGTPGAGRHTVHLRDQFRIPRPGETEVKVEDSPGITVAKARVGAADDATHDYRFVGPGGPVSDDGLDVEFTSTTSAAKVPNDVCGKAPAPATSRGAGTRWILIGVAGIVVLGAIVLGLLRLRRAS